MSVASILDKIRDAKKAGFWIPFIITALYRVLFLSTVELAVQYPDSATYIDFPFQAFFQLRLLSGRTPVYPAIIRICKLLFSENNFLYAVVALQIAVSIVSLVFLYKAVMILTQGCIFISALTMMFYGCSQVTIGWDALILTESFALSGTVVFIFLFLRYLENNRLKLGIGLIIFSFVLVFLRPTFLLFHFVLLVFLVFRCLFIRKFRIINLKLIGVMLASCLLVLAYSYLFQLQHGIFSLTDALPRQNLITCIDRGYYKDSSDAEFVEMIGEPPAGDVAEQWAIMIRVLGHFGNQRTLELTKECILKQGLAYWGDSLGSMLYQMPNHFYAYEQPKLEIEYFTSTYNLQADSSLLGGVIQVPARALSMINFAFAYLFCTAAVVLSVYFWIKRKTPPWKMLVFAIIPSGIILSTFLATCGEFMRTSICALPFIYTGIAFYIYCIIRNSKTISITPIEL